MKIGKKINHTNLDENGNLFESRYKFRELSTGFEISGEDRSPVQVHLDGPKITVLDLHNQISKEFGLYSVREMLKQTSSILMRNWQASAVKCKNSFVKNKIKNWATTRCSKALGKKFASHWRELLKEADPIHIAVQKAVFAATQKQSKRLMIPEFYCEANKYVISDIINYRAAAVSVDFANLDFTQWSLDGQFSDSADWWDVDVRRKLHREAIDSWQKLYSFNHKPYTSLNKTLAKLPGGIPVGLLCNLPQIELKRPVTTRLELLTLLLSNTRMHDEVIFRSSRSDIRRALARYASHMRVKDSFRKTLDISVAVSYITDCTERHNGNFNGLCQKSILWHRNFARNAIVRDYGYSESVPTTLPPIPLPANRNVRFLSTVGELISEGQALNHCVGSYASKAVKGSCFIFHADYEGEVATIEVDPSGRVVQLKGKHNCQNKATKYAAGVLKTWGKKFPKNNNVLVLSNGNDDFELGEF